MTSLRISYGFLLSFLLGLFALRWWQSPSYPALLWTIVLVAMLIGLTTGMLSKKRTLGWTVSACALGFSIALLRTISASVPSTEGSIVLLPSETMTMIGVIADAPDKRPTLTRYTVEIESVLWGKRETAAHGRLLVVDRSTWPEFRFGDRVSIKGKLLEPKIIGDFDYPNYLRSQRIDRTMERATIEKIEGIADAPWTIRFAPERMLGPVRDWFQGQLRSTMTEPQTSLLDGLLTGYRGGISKKLADNFRRAGLTHIVAVSGFNITVILSLLSGLLFFLPIKRRIWPLAVGIIAFTLFVGAGAPVVRACIMGILGLIAIRAERQTTPRMLILWTAFFMLLWNPLSLWYDPSFQLSFLAVIGIGEFGPALKRRLTIFPEAYAIRESLATTLAAQIATMPVSVLIFRQFSIIAPVSNVLVAPLIPLAMLLGFIASLVHAVFPLLGLVIGYVDWALLTAILKIAEISGELPFASLTF